MGAIFLADFWNYGEIIGASLAVFIAIVSAVRMWMSINNRLNNVEGDVTELKHKESQHHNLSMETIEKMRIERHEEITRFRDEIIRQYNEIRKENKDEHKDIIKVLGDLTETLTKVTTILSIKEPSTKEIVSKKKI